MITRHIRGGDQFVAVSVKITEHLAYRRHHFVQGLDLLKFEGGFRKFRGKVGIFIKSSNFYGAAKPVAYRVVDDG